MEPIIATEVDPGNPWIGPYPPEALCCEDGHCAECLAPIGEHLRTDENGYDHGVWISAWEMPDGRFVCEDCSIRAYDGELGTPGPFTVNGHTEVVPRGVRETLRYTYRNERLRTPFDRYQAEQGHGAASGGGNDAMLGVTPI